ncbi:MAG: hypothetical protein IIT98_03725 [Kiritimatiellae bacterium]|nr:hypothetical protein [Kiritimatiellia bacterium]
MSEKCCICGRELPNRWAVAKRESAGGVERCYCHLHAADDFNNKPDAKGGNMEEPKSAMAAREKEIAKAASGELAKRAWSECAALAGKLGGGVKALWAKIRPDRSPEAMLSTLNENLEGNKKRLGEIKPGLDGLYREIGAKKREYQSAAPVRQRLLKIELQTLMARYKSLEREFAILCENERSIETVKGRFLEILAYGLRGKLDAGMVDRLADDIDDKAEDAEDVQDALGDLERAGKRTDRAPDDFEAELAGFDGELGISGAADGVGEGGFNNKETTDENNRTDLDGGIVA